MKTWPEARAAARHAFRADEFRAAVDLIRAQDTPSAEFDALIVHALFATGLRRSELARVRVKDLRFDNGLLWVFGKRDDVFLPLTAEALTVFRRLVELAGADNPDVTLLPGDGAHLVSRAFIRTESVVDKIRKGRAWSPHMARHTYISLLAAGGVDLRCYSGSRGSTRSRSCAATCTPCGQFRAVVRAWIHVDVARRSDGRPPLSFVKLIPCSA